MEASEGGAEELGAFLRELGPRAGEAYVTAAEKLREQGRQEGQAALLLRLLSSRFDTVPEALQARVKAGTSSELETWAERVLTVSAIEDLFQP